MTKHWTGVLLSGVCLTALAGVAAAQEQTVVTFWGQSFGATDLAAIESIVTAYEEEHPEVDIQFTPVSSSETDESKLMTAVRGGVGPDLYFLNRFAAQERAGQGILENLQPYIEAEGVDLASQYSEFAWNDVANEEGVFALPFDTDARVLFYNKAMLRDAGIDPEELDPSNGVVTPERIMEIAEAVSRRDAQNQYEQMGFIPWFQQGWHYTWGTAFGGTFQSGPCDVTPTEPGVVAGINFMGESAQAIDYPAAMQFINSYFPPNSPDQANPFFSGRLAMMVSGDWVLPQLEQYAPDLEWGMTYIPSPDGEVTSWSAGWSVAIPAGAKNVQAAYDFARFFAGEEGQRIYVEQSGHLPTWKSLLEEDIYDENHSFFKDLLAETSPLFQLQTGALYWDELSRAQEAVMSGQSEAEAALADVEARVQPRLDRACAS